MKGRFASEGEAGGEDLERTKGQAVRAPRPKQCRQFTQRRVAEALPEIVDRFVKEAKLGSIAHAKALVSLSGLDKTEDLRKSSLATNRAGRRQSLARKLLEDLKRGCETKAEGPKEGPEHEIVATMLNEEVSERSGHGTGWHSAERYTGGL